jgi:hypothetical protein
VKTGKGVRQGCCLSLIALNLYSQHFTNEALEGSGDFKLGNQVLGALKYANDLVVLTTGQRVFQSMTDRLAVIGTCYGMGGGGVVFTLEQAVKAKTTGITLLFL